MSNHIADECPTCHCYETLIETDYWPTNLTDPEASQGYCSCDDCDYEWEY